MTDAVEKAKMGIVNAFKLIIEARLRQLHISINNPGELSNVRSIDAPWEDGYERQVPQRSRGD